MFPRLENRMARISRRTRGSGANPLGPYGVRAVADALEPRRLLADSPVEPVIDLSPSTQSSFPPQTGQQVVAAGNLAFYTATYTPVGGQEVWRTDGTAAGTFLLKEVMPGAAGSNPRHLTAVGDALFFAARSPEHGLELWTSDGTPGGTVLVKDIRPGPDSGVGGDFRSLGDRLLFTANDGVAGTELWVSDGTAAGTRMIADLTPGPDNTTTPLSRPVAGQVFFPFAGELWRTDGTAGGTRLVKDVRPGPTGSLIGQMLAAQNLLYFIADDGTGGREIWRTDGTDAGTVSVTDLNFDIFDAPQLIAAAGDTLYFRPAFGRLWKSDGTAAGTAAFADLNPQDAVAVGNTLYFVDRAPGASYKLWKTNGTAAGTAVVDTPAGDLGFGGPTLDFNAVAWNGRLYFRGQTPANGWELFSTDGTTAGTRLLKDIVPGPATSGAGTLDYLAPARDKLYFAAQAPVVGHEPWVTDGTEAGTRLIRDVNVVSISSNPAALTRVGSRAFFFVGDGDGTLHVTDGTAAGTSAVKWVRLRTPSGDGPYTAGAGDTFFFHGSGTEVGETHISDTLWKSDGTAPGTVPVLYSQTGERISGPAGLKAAGNKVFFVAADQASRNHLWASDGTAAGTYKLFSLAGPTVPTALKEMVDVGGVAFFPWGREVWRSDGTPAGTYPVFNALPTPAGLFLGQFATVSGRLMFVADDGTGRKLYRSGGTAETTHVVKPLPAGSVRGSPTGVAAGDLLIFDGPGGIWRSDGTPEGTFSLNADASLQATGWTTGRWAAVGERLVFATPSAGVGWEVWGTDGTAAGTRLLKNIHPTGDSNPQFLVSAGGAVYFRATAGGDPLPEYDLWRSDGTPEGTYRVAWSAPTPNHPQYLIELNGEVLFAGTDLGDPVTGGGPGREVMKVRDLVKPSLGAARFRHQGPPAWSATFTEDVSATFGPEDVRVTNLTTAQDVPPAQWTVSESASAGSMVVTLRFAAGIPDGNYRVRVLSAGVADRAGNAMEADRTFDFFVLSGDVNRDRAVNGTDFALLAANFGRSGRTYAEGDLNGDGTVNGTDFALLAGNFGRSLPEPAAAVVAPPPAPAPAKPQVARRSRPATPRRLATPPRAIRPTDASPLRRGLRAQRQGR
jgi:ELWxxDGT repeat protein